MKSKIFFGLAVAAAFVIASSNARAQEAAATVANGVAAATSTAGVTTQPCAECDECQGGRAFGPGFGAGFGARGGFPGAGFGGASSIGDRIRDNIASDRPIIEASPYANPNGSLQDWNRFRYYPYGYYPHNFADRANMSVPKYHPGYQNYYPVPRRYHEGHHFHLDVF